MDTWRVLFPDGREPLSLEKLALASGYRVKGMREVMDCSERYVYEVFVRDIGLPPKIWMRQERMVVARRMMGGGAGFSEVSERLGFASTGGFRREFRDIHGVLPREYVKGLGKGGAGWAACDFLSPHGSDGVR